MTSRGPSVSQVQPEDVVNITTTTVTAPAGLATGKAPATAASGMMRAVAWYGTHDLRFVERAKPVIEDANDVILHVTCFTICGSDLFMYEKSIAGMEKGDILGHEFMGIVEQVGPAVSKLKVGQRVVVSAAISCGNCEFCQEEKFSLCERTNMNPTMDKMYGDRTAGIFGYSHLTGGYSGGQADYVRVPFADVNCLPVPDSLPDDKVLYLSDIVCTGYHATEVSGVKEGDTVAVWGCGPVGLMALAWAKYKGANQLFAIDNLPYRLDVAKKVLGAEIINFNEENPVAYLKKAVKNGPDVCIDAVGARYSKTWGHTIAKAMMIETDSVDVINEVLMAVKKGGRVGIVGDYIGYANHFNVGALMEKALTVGTGQVFVQKYWKKLLEIIEKGDFDPTFVISHYLRMEETIRAYSTFDKKEDNMLKVFIHTGFDQTKSIVSEE